MSISRTHLFRLSRLCGVGPPTRSAVHVIMDFTDTSDESSLEFSQYDSREATPEKDPSKKLIAGFLWLLVLFTATSYIAQSIIFQSLEDFSKDIRNAEDICNGNSPSFNAKECKCIYDYLDGLDHPEFQILFHKMQLPPAEKSKTGKREEARHRKGDSSEFDPENLYIDPKSYVIGCGNSFPVRRMANVDVCERLEKLMTTDLYTKWWYDPGASCYNSIFNTIKRVHRGLVALLVLILIGVILTPIHLLQTFEII